jgi:ADP-heptose:LPS heptosyltransferase
MKAALSPEKPVRTVLVVALTRMGDIYELYPMVVSLIEKYPGCRVFLVAYREFCHALGPLTRFSGIFPVDGPKLRSKIRSGESPMSVYRSLNALIGALNELDGDLLINLTPNRIGAVLGYVIRAREKKGLHMTPDGFRAHYGSWITYLSTLVRNRLYNSLNLSDLFLKIGGVERDETHSGIGIPEKAKKAVRLRLDEAGAGTRILSIATGASADLKRWPPEAFAELIRILLVREKNVHAILLGSGPQDAGRNARISEVLLENDPGLLRRLHDWTGKTTVDELFALLESSDILVSNDTGTMHAAALLRTPVVCLSFANLFYPETGPASPGNVVVYSMAPCSPCGPDSRCTDPVCRKDLEPASIARIVLCRMSFPKDPDKNDMRRLVHRLSGLLPTGRADIAVSATDAWGEIRFRSLGPGERTPEAFFRRVYERLWREEFEEKRGDRGSFDVPVPEEAEEVLKSARKIEAFAMEALRGIADVRLCLGKDGGAGRVSEEILGRFEQIDTFLEETAWSCPPVGPLVVFFQMEKESIDIWDPFEMDQLVGRTEETYRNLLRRVRLFMTVVRDLGSRSLNETPDRSTPVLAAPVL